MINNRYHPTVLNLLERSKFKIPLGKRHGRTRPARRDIRVEIRKSESCEPVRRRTWEASLGGTQSACRWHLLCLAFIVWILYEH